MRGKRWKFPVLLVVLAALVAGYFIWVQDSELKKIAKQVPSQVKVDLSAEGIELRQGENGQPKWLMRAERASYVRENGEVEVAKPEIRYYVGENREELRVVASKGEVSQGADTARLGPGVQADMPPFALRADEMLYTGKDKKIELKGNILMTRDQASVETERAVVDLGTKDITATGGVEASFTMASLTPPAKTPADGKGQLN